MEEEKYLLWASDKNWNYNSPVFWGKDNCGYYSTLEDCQLYTKEEALKYATDVDIPVKLSELMKYKKTIFEGVYKILNESGKEYKDKIGKDNKVQDCITCNNFRIETFTGVCDKFGILDDIKDNCPYYIVSED